MTTDNITSVNNLNNNSVLYADNTTARAQSAQTGKLFSTILQSKINNATMSVASFDNISGTSSNDSGSLFGSSGSSLFGGDGFGSVLGTSLLSGLFTNGLNGDSAFSGTETSGSGINSNTMLMFIFLAMMMNNGNDNSGMGMMMTSLSGALNGRITGKSYMNSLNNQVANSFRGTSLTGSSFKATYVAPGTGSYPSNMSKACSPSIVSNVGSRNANLYRSVVDQFNVETNSRYTPYKNGSTYCNIYVWDVTTAMGAQIPHRTDSQGNIATADTKNVKYMTANAMYDWLGSDKGREYGWKEVSAEEAQRYANMGCPAVTSWKNPKGHGHIQMVVPSKDGTYNESKGVAISQAGSKVISYGYITDVYKGSRLKDIKYFVHA